MIEKDYATALPPEGGDFIPISNPADREHIEELERLEKELQDKIIARLEEIYNDLPPEETAAFLSELQRRIEAGTPIYDQTQDEHSPGE